MSGSHSQANSSSRPSACFASHAARSSAGWCEPAVVSTTTRMVLSHMRPSPRLATRLLYLTSSTHDARGCTYRAPHVYDARGPLTGESQMANERSAPAHRLLSSFSGHGGKLLFYRGVSRPL